ncbi:MAG: class I SAM-dependent methyltransferase [Desulfovibrio sp.]|uniref:class I SAM-dependent methyltransferase n=1 Tax=Desulfovibrio sp. 7SRBS1 TaxID=3378064 RepID=UPI003B3C748D
MSETQGYPVQVWLEEHELKQIEYSAYWNDEQAEQDKDWWVLDGDFSRMEDYLKRTGTLGALQRCIAKAGELGRPVRGTGADVAAGVLWAVPHLISAGAGKVHCIEFSQHRLLKLGPAVLEQYGVGTAQAELCLGSFYDIRLPDCSLDFVLLSTSFHHAKRPQELLEQVKRILKPSGCVLMFGEYAATRPSLGVYLTQAAQALCSRLPKGVQESITGKVYPKAEWLPNFEELNPPDDPVMGDHFFTLEEYGAFFAEAGFVCHQCTENFNWGCVLVPKGDA